MKVSIIIPAYNEKDNVISLARDIIGKIDNVEIIIVDDSIEDNISSAVEKMDKVNHIFRGKKLGRGSAVIEGIVHLIENSDTKIFVEMDADYSHDPNELEKNLNLFKDKDYDLLISSRYLSESKIINWPLPRRVFSFMANLLARILLRVPVSDYTNGYRIYSISAANHIAYNCGKIGDGFIILSEILVELYYNKFKIGETKSKFVNRVRGESSVNFKEIINSLIGLIKIYKLKNQIKKKNQKNVHN